MQKGTQFNSGHRLETTGCICFWRGSFEIFEQAISHQIGSFTKQGFWAGKVFGQKENSRRTPAIATITRQNDWKTIRLRLALLGEIIFPWTPVILMPAFRHAFVIVLGHVHVNQIHAAAARRLAEF